MRCYSLIHIIVFFFKISNRQFTMSEHKDEVVISGIGGLFPECDNVDELKELLFSKTNGVTINSSRWKPSKIKNCFHFTILRIYNTFIRCVTQIYSAQLPEPER